MTRFTCRIISVPSDGCVCVGEGGRGAGFGARGALSVDHWPMHRSVENCRGFFFVVKASEPWFDTMRKVKKRQESDHFLVMPLCEVLLVQVLAQKNDICHKSCKKTRSGFVGGIATMWRTRVSMSCMNVMRDVFVTRPYRGPPPLSRIQRVGWMWVYAL